MSLININIPSAASDVVGVFDQGFNQVFPLARPIKALIDESARAMEHPVETGSVITDHIIFQPNEIEILLILPSNEYRSVYNQIEQIYKAATILSVQTRATTYKNMFIYRMPHQEDPDLFDTISIGIRLRQILFSPTTVQSLPPAAVKTVTDQSTINNGLQQPGITQKLPTPDSVVWKDSPGFKLPVKSTFKGSADLPVAPITLQQAEQLLDASRPRP